MTNQHRLGTLAIAFGLVASQGCKSQEANADRDADRVIEDQPNADKKSGDLATATDVFERSRDLSIQKLNGQRAVIASQPNLINTIAQSLPLTDAGRMVVNERVMLLQTRLDEAGNLISGLQTSTASDWKRRDDAVSDAMSRVEDARKDAWKALDDAPRTDRSS